MPEYGAGPALDENFDLNIDSSGDVDSTSGPNELRKDLAINIGAALADGTNIDQPRTMRNGLIGQVVGDGGTLDDAEQAIERVVGRDERISAVLNVAVRVPNDGLVDSAEVRVRLLVNDTVVSFDRVFAPD